jgi:hypothetical protein
MKRNVLICVDLSKHVHGFWPDSSQERVAKLMIHIHVKVMSMTDESERRILQPVLRKMGD